MRHYEIILILHPDQSDKISSVNEKYKKIIEEDHGIIHRLEDWGRRQLSYSIKKLHKAHYILMNIEVFPKTINTLATDFRFNKIIIRHMILCVKKAVSELSPMLKLKDEKQDKK